MTINEIILVAGLAVPYAYVVVRVAAIAYFTTKLRYNRDLTRTLIGGNVHEKRR